MRFFIASLLLAATSSLVAAQNLPSCALTCFTNGAAATPCGGITNITCLCNDAAFETALGGCLQSSCDAADASAGVAFGVASCEAVGITITTTALGSATGTTTAAAKRRELGRIVGLEQINRIASATGTAPAAASSSKPAGAGSLQVQGGLAAGAILAGLAALVL
ncbi:hypothetical protein RQP46_002036 [Phenoliferia psychrophenolica]